MDALIATEIKPPDKDGEISATADRINLGRHREDGRSAQERIEDGPMLWLHNGVKMKTRGRKPIAENGEKMRNRNFRATDAEWEKCLLLGGGAFLRAKIKAAKVPQ